MDARGRRNPSHEPLDIGLPELNGYEVAKSLRTREKHRRMILIAMTGYGQERDCQRSLDAGCDAHLTKPVAPQALRAFLRELDGKAVQKS
jgi:CheY-like chemotaxis protein